MPCEPPWWSCGGDCLPLHLPLRRQAGPPPHTTTTEAGASPEPLWADSAASDSVGSGDCGRRGRAAGGCCAWARGLGGAASPSKLCPGGAAPCFMFMFRSRKNALVKRAWKARRAGLGDAREDVPQALKGAALQLLRRLTEAQLDLLVTALDSGGVEPGECVLVPRVPDAGAGGAALAPHLLMVRVWRWPDLHDAPGPHGSAPLRRLPCCAARNDHVYVCANPYHWARVLQTESPPPPYRRFSSRDLLRPEDAAPSEDSQCLVESQETGGTHDYGSYSTHGPGK
nr:mothers against decapentaplegic homolog 6-like [Penaeus vannamei]